jgi:hypothetical protein
MSIASNNKTPTPAARSVQHGLPLCLVGRVARDVIENWQCRLGSLIIV